MDALYLLLIGLLFWPTIRSFAELVIALRDREVAALVDASGWLTLSLVCLVGAASCMERQAPLVAVAFTAVPLVRLVAPRVDVSKMADVATRVVASARAGRDDR